MSSEEIQLLTKLSSNIPQAILIGGWSTYALLEEGITHDIDIIVEPYMRGTLQSTIDGYSENSHFGTNKGTGSFQGIPVDIYFLHESRLEGEVSLDVTKLSKYVDSEWNGFSILSKEAVIASKLPAAIGRAESEKGKKDSRAILSLIQIGSDPVVTRKIFEDSQSILDTTAWRTAEECIKDNLATRAERDIAHKFFFAAY